jgi:hypothetical protein
MIVASYGQRAQPEHEPPFWTVRAAAMSCIQDIRSWVFCASACRWGEARMGRWQAVGEIRIRHWFRKDTRTAGA